MGMNLKAEFETRRNAEMAVERLVQEYEVERTSIFISPVGDNNSAGEELAGSDAKGGQPSTDERYDQALDGMIAVSVDIDDDTKAEAIRSAFAEFDGHAVNGG